MPSDLSSVVFNQATVKLSEQIIFEQLDFSFSLTGISFLVGENGAGKTQLIRTIHGLNKLSDGQIIAPPLHRQAYSAQTPVLLNRSVHENLKFLRGSSVCPSIYYDQHIDETIDTFGLSDVLDKPVHYLSGGQKKCLSIARVFLQPASLYLLDEPSASVDFRNVLLIESAINRLLKQEKKIIMSTHDFFHMERLFQEGRDELHLIRAGTYLAKKNRLDIDELKHSL